MDVVQRCYNDMQDSICTIDPPKDAHIVVEQNVTGYSVSNDFVFMDLDCPPRILETNGESAVDSTMNSTATLKRGKMSTNGKQITRKHSMHQRIFGGSGSSNGKSNGTASEYGNISPQQRCRKLESKIQHSLVNSQRPV